MSTTNRYENGLCARFQFVEGESRIDFQLIVEDLLKEHQPGTLTESILVSRMAEHFWLGKRAQDLQAGTLNGYHSDRDRVKLLTVYIRYETANNRAFSQCLKELLMLQKERRKQSPKPKKIPAGPPIEPSVSHENASNPSSEQRELEKLGD